MKRQNAVGQSELEILKLIACHGPMTSRQVFDTADKERGWKRTTITKMMDRLLEKGHLRRSETGGVWQYQSVRSREELERGLVKDFIETTLNGSLQPFVLYLQDQNGLTADQTKLLEGLIHSSKEDQS